MQKHLLHKAIGFPFGADEDAAFIIAWLELNHFDGLKILNNLINSNDHKYDGIVQINKLESAELANSGSLEIGNNH